MLVNWYFILLHNLAVINPKMLPSKPGWLQKPVKGVLLDITGVLYNSGKGLGQAIPGSINAVER